MWTYIIPSVCFVMSIPILTKWFAEFHVNRTRKLLLEQFQSIATSYTENGTPAELKQMIEDLEEIMEELKFLEKNDWAMRSVTENIF